MSPATTVAVIGCGAAGLVAARELLREGLEVTVYEQNARVGGIWDYQDEVEDDLLGRDPRRRRVHSSMYKDLRCNLPRQLMSYSDFPLTVECLGEKSVDARRYCSHQEVLCYLHRFAEEFQLWPCIRLNTQVVSVQPLRAGTQDSCNGAPAPCRWAVTTVSSNSDTGSDPEVQEFDALVSCVGNYFEPNLPDVEGMDTFPGRQMHCHNYRTPEPFAGQRVLVVGASFSGEEIARHIASVAAHVYHSARTWTRPAGSQGSQGWQRPNLTRLPMLTRLTPEGTAHFQGGECVEGVESIVYSTGYKYQYPWLDHLGLLSTDEMRVTPLYKHVFVPATAPSLAFIGLLWKSIRNLQFELQAKWVARVLSGRVKLPCQAAMEDDIQAFYDLLEQHGVPVRYTHNQTDAMPVNQWAYNDWLVNACGPDVSQPASWRKRMHTMLSQLIFGRPDTFRDEVMTSTEAQLYAEADADCARTWEQHQKHKQLGQLH